MHQRIHCPITGEKTEIIFSRPYTHSKIQAMVRNPEVVRLLNDKPYEIRYAPSSGLVFQAWVLEDHELSLLYKNSETNPDFQEEVKCQKLHAFAHQAEEILVFRQVCKNKCPVVLDFGSSWGKWANMALAFGCDVYGLDINPQAIQFCSQRGIKMIDYAQMSGMQFDFINCDQVLEHVKDPLGLMKQFKRCLKPEGCIKISTPNSPKLLRKLRKGIREDDPIVNPVEMDPLAPLVHINLFSRESLMRLGQHAGLKPFQQPFFKWFGASQLWNIPRQLNRNLITAYKRWTGKGTYIWFQNV